jgi:tryptophan-rich sensory protein
MRKWLEDGLGLAIFVASTFAVASIGGMLTYPAIPEWYAHLNKPAWNPPNWIFGPVWTVLYLLMAIAGWLIWRIQPRGWHWPLFQLQLLLNAAWSGLFFTLQRPDLAFAEIVLLWLTVLATMITFGRTHRVAGALFLPYWIWVTFAALLNFSLWRLNS